VDRREQVFKVGRLIWRCFTLSSWWIEVGSGDPSSWTLPPAFRGPDVILDPPEKVGREKGRDGRTFGIVL